MKPNGLRLCVIILAMAIIGTSLQAAYKKNMIVATNSRWTTMDPSVSYSTETTYLRNMYETLMEVARPDSDHAFNYILATKLTALAGGKEFDVKLRQGVTFQDGTPFNAKAVKFSIDRTKRMNKGPAFIWNDLTEIKVTGEYSVRFIFKNVVPLPILLSANNGAFMISPKVGNAGEEYFKRGNWNAGTGGYRLVRYKPGESWILTKNKNYWRGWKRPHITNVLYKFVPRPLTQYQMLKSGEADWVAAIPPESYSAIEKNPKLRLLKVPSAYNHMLFVNTRNKPFDKKKVRQALAHAIPFDDIIKVGFSGLATQARSIIPRGQFGYSEEVKQNDYDLKKARRLLREAGYPHGFKANLNWCSQNSEQARYAVLIKDSFKKIGVDVNLKGLLFKAQWAIAKGPKEKRQDLFLSLWWPTISDPYETLFALLNDESQKAPAWNLSYWYNPDFDRLIKKASNLLGVDPAESLRLYKQAQNIVVDQAMMLPIVDMLGKSPMSVKIKNYDPYPFQQGFLYKIYLEQ